MAYIYIDLEYATRTHDKILAVSGGSHGMLDLGRLESILHHIQNDDYYPSFIDKLTHLVYAVNKGHCFSDGNKRTSIALGAFLMEVNGLDVLVSKFMIEMENVAVAVADNLIDKELLGDIIDSLLNEEEYNEPLQLRIINCLDIYNNDPDAETI
ncbi:MAG TPA: type II toxin-antitoxin system death-on-curing family toxin [Flavitalea sp.]|nr:type II toxin-antitoxin system death-on-curing family toxin [Flavitalea sp.]